MSEIIDGVTYYTVRFLNYAATDLLGTASVASGGDATALAPKPETIEGKTFTGWNVDITHVVEDMTVRPVYEDCLTVNFYGFDLSPYNRLVHCNQEAYLWVMLYLLLVQSTK